MPKLMKRMTKEKARKRTKTALELSLESTWGQLTHGELATIGTRTTHSFKPLVIFRHYFKFKAANHW